MGVGEDVWFIVSIEEKSEWIFQNVTCGIK
jgi:hypothetical protein